jgi:hypothetical protein
LVPKKVKGQIEAEVANIKKTLVKAQGEADEVMEEERGIRATSVESGKGGEVGPRKKGGPMGGKGKGPGRPGGTAGKSQKFWN